MKPLFLSEITLRDEYAARLIPRDIYGWHKVLWKFFPGQQERDFLYRVDSLPGVLRLYVLSSSPAQVPAHLPQEICRSREIPEKFLSHAAYRFQLRANPTRRVKVDARTGRRKENGLRAPIIDLNDLAAWLGRKGEQGGFTIPCLTDWPEDACPLSILHEGRNGFRKPGLSQAHHHSVQFTGILHVEQPVLFRECVRNGIGSAKAFGFGLLLLQPVSQ